LYEGKYDRDADKAVYSSPLHIGHILKFVIL